MTIGIGVLVTAVGAILAYAVEVQTEGFDWHAAGVITMIAGVVITVAAAIATLATRRRVVAPLATTAYTTPVASQTVVEDRYVQAATPVVDQSPRVVEQRVVRRTSP